MSRTDRDYHRQDLKIPLSLYEKLQSIAVEKFDAKINHRSGKPQITATILKLIEMGITALDNGMPSNQHNSDVNSNITLDTVQKMIDTAISSLRDELLAIGISRPDDNTLVYADTDKETQTLIYDQLVDTKVNTVSYSDYTVNYTEGNTVVDTNRAAQPSEAVTIPLQPFSATIENEKDNQLQKEKIEGSEVNSTVSLEPLSQNALEKRLCPSSTQKGKIVKKEKDKGKENLLEWSRKLDPDDIAWEYDHQLRKYKPIFF